MNISELNKKYNTNIPEILKPEEIGNPGIWEKEGRVRLKEILQREEYGILPEYDKKNNEYKVVLEEKVLGMDAWHKKIEITINCDGRSHTFPCYMFIPLGAKNVPMFLYINRLEWMRRAVCNGTIDQRYPLREIIKRGYGLVFFCTEDISSEMLDTLIDYREGLHEALGIDSKSDTNLGSVGLWSFAAMRIMDYLETDDIADATKVCVVGHSRLGKTALFTGAFDERFAITVSNDSGAGGAALFKTKEGEHVKYMIDTIPYWFCNNYKKYYNAEDKMEFDQHFLLSLIAPRPLYVASGETDDWADPQAEFDGALLASEVYEKVYNIKGLSVSEKPALDTPSIDGNVAYHVRTGPHNILRYDWDQFMNFADKFFK